MKYFLNNESNGVETIAFLCSQRQNMNVTSVAYLT